MGMGLEICDKCLLYGCKLDQAGGCPEPGLKLDGTEIGPFGWDGDGMSLTTETMLWTYGASAV